MNHWRRITLGCLTIAFTVAIGVSAQRARRGPGGHSPVVLIEFDHERRVAPFRSQEPSRDHIHAVLRTPNGNDYGKSLLRQHYEHHHGGDTHEH